MCFCAGAYGSTRGLRLGRIETPHHLQISRLGSPSSSRVCTRYIHCPVVCDLISNDGYPSSEDRNEELNARREGDEGGRVNLRSVRDVQSTSFLQYRINCFQRRNDFIGRSDLRSLTCLGGVYRRETKAIILLPSILVLRNKQWQVYERGIRIRSYSMTRLLTHLLNIETPLS